MLTNGNHLSAQGFDALFGSCSQQEQEYLLAELAGLGILVDTSAAIPSSRKATSFCRSDFTSKNQKPEDDNSFGGGSGAGMNLSPVAFLIVKGDSVRLMPVAPPPGTAVDRVVEMVPDVIDKVTGFIEKQQDKDKSQG